VRDYYKARRSEKCGCQIIASRALRAISVCMCVSLLGACMEHTHCSRPACVCYHFMAVENYLTLVGPDTRALLC
jgi:hypothetical protein